MTYAALRRLLPAVAVAALLAPRMTVASQVHEEPQAQEEAVFHAGDPLPPMPAPPESMEEILASPCFEAEPGHDCAYYLERAAEIFALRARYTNKRIEVEREKVSEAIAEIQRNHKDPSQPIDYGDIGNDLPRLSVQYEREDSEAVCRKFKETVYPRLLPFALSDDTPEKEGDRALGFCVECLRWTNDFDKIEEIRRDLLAKEAKAIADGNEELAKRCDHRIRSINTTLFSPILRLVGIDYNEAEANDEVKENAVKLGDQIVEEVDRDPRLLTQADMFYIVVGKHVDGNIALQFREKILPKFDKEKARKELEKEHGHSVNEYPFGLLIEPRPFDESLLEVEPGQSDEYYAERLKQLKDAAKEFHSQIHPYAEVVDVSIKTDRTRRKIEFWKAIQALKDGKSTSARVPLAILAPGDVEYLKKEYDQAKKSANAELVSAVSYALASQELFSALETSREKKSNDALKAAIIKYVAEAKKNEALAKGAAQLGQFLANQDSDAGTLFLTTAIRKFRETPGVRPAYVEQCVRALDETRARAERFANRKAAEQNP